MTTLLDKRIVQLNQIENQLAEKGYIVMYGCQSFGTEKAYIYTFDNFIKLKKKNSPRLATAVISYFYLFNGFPIPESTLLKHKCQALKKALPTL